MKSIAKSKLVYLLLGFVLAVVIGVCLYNAVPTASAQSSTSTESSDLTFLMNDDSQSYKVRVLDKSKEEITIPSTYNGLPVLAIDDSGFMGCTSLEKIVIPSSVKYIGNNAFMRCTNLKKVLGMSGVTSYGNNAFSMCSKLEYLILPSKLTSVGTSMLRNVNATVYSRTMEEDLLQLNSACLSAYSGNIVYGNDLVYEAYTDPLTGEEGVSLVEWQNIDLDPQGTMLKGTTLIVESWHSDNGNGNGIEGKVLNIAECAFAYCNAENIIIRNSAGFNHSINLESFAFACNGATNITIEANITMNDPNEGVSTAIFFDSAALQSVSLPDTINTIPQQMFMDCKKLKEIKFSNDTSAVNHLPDKITKIDGGAFYSCYSIPELYISEDINFIGENAFYYWGNNDIHQTIYINLKEESQNWSINWASGIKSENCDIEFTANTTFIVDFIVEQTNVINPTRIESKVVNRNGTLNDLNLSNPTSISHNFNGKWYTSELRSEGTEFDLNSKIKSDLTLYAGWTIKKFNVTFTQNKYCSFVDISTGNYINSQISELDYNSSYTFSIEVNDGYKNFKVFKNAELITPVTGSVYTIQVCENINITVSADLITYTATFKNLRRGDNPNGAIVYFNVESEEIIFKKPIWDAYEICDWNITSIPKKTSKNLEIEAVWKNPKVYSITFKLDDDPNASNPNGVVKQYTVEDNVSLMNPTSPGYTSGAWMKNNTIINGWDKDTYFEDMELTVKWGEGRKYNISFDLNGGSGSIEPIKVTYGEYLPSITKPTLYDYKLLGFYSLNNGVQYYDSNMNAGKWYQANDDILQAKWEQEYFYITFIQNNGFGVGGPETPMRIKYGQTWQTISMPTRKGYSINGYYYGNKNLESHKIYNANGTYNRNNIVFGSTYDIKKNITLISFWEISEYYGFVVDKLYPGTNDPETITSVLLGWEDSYQITAPETYEYQNKGARGFTEWKMIMNGTDGYNAETNPWKDYSTNLTLSFRVSEIISNYYPNYKAADGNIYFRAFYHETSGGGSCVAEGTLITLADGSQKAVELLTGNEQLLVWNLKTGSFDSAPILFIDSDAASYYEIINLYFSDGTSVKVASEHAFWDFDLNKYVYLRNDADKYIGHWFNKQITNADGTIDWTKVELTDVVVNTEYTTTWSPVTYGHLCYYVNGMLSMPGGIEGLFNIFEVDAETMTYDKAAFEADIATYGLFTYEEFNELYDIPELMFEACGGQYLKVAIGKGLLDYSTLSGLVERYGAFFEN